MYHNITPYEDRFSVSIKNFEKQMNFLKMLNFNSVKFIDLKKRINKKIIITFDDAYENIFKFALPILDKLKFKATIFVVTNSLGKYNFWDSNKPNYKREKIMNEKQIKEAIKKGHEIGSHGYSHLNLKKLNLKKKKEVIIKPLNYFKKKFRYTIRTFSYPFGQYDVQSLKIVKENYKYAVTTKRSRYNRTFLDNSIPRVPINSTTNLFKFFLKINTIYEDVKYKN